MNVNPLPSPLKFSGLIPLPRVLGDPPSGKAFEKAYTQLDINGLSTYMGLLIIAMVY
jgi:hypothetical protein